MPPWSPRAICRRLILFLVLWLGGAGQAWAANCDAAASGGPTGPADWQTYCWFDLSTFDDTQARSGTGQNLSFVLPDGSMMAFNLKITGPALVSHASPSWSGSAVGNTAFLGMAGKPVLYQTAGGTSVVTISGISLTPPPGSAGISSYMLVVADGESTNDYESLSYTTNGGGWTELDRAGPISGSSYPSISGIGTSNVQQNGVPGYVGAHILGSQNPTSASITLVGGGLQGVMLALRYASLSLDLAISGARADPADQFRYDIRASGSGNILASAASSGTGLGPFSYATLNAAASFSLTIGQHMETGSASSLAAYRSSLSCHNATGSTTNLPVDLLVTSYDFGTLNFGDFITCRFTDTPHPHLKLVKALGAGGRQYDTDQFVLSIQQAGTTVASTTTTGTGTTLGSAATAMTEVVPGNTYTFLEAAAGTTSFDQYQAALGCSNANSGSTTVLPVSAGGSITPQIGDVVTCILTNARRAPNATLHIAKSSAIIADPVNGSQFPKAIPGSTVRYSITVWNTGPSPVDAGTVLLVDLLPAQIRVGTAANPVFQDGAVSSALSFGAGDIGYSAATTAPASFSECNYQPTVPFDPQVRYVCINPKGAMSGAAGTPASFTVSFTAQVN